VATWSSRSSWGAWSTWGGEVGTLWSDLDVWGNLGTWFDPDGFPQLPNPVVISAYAAGHGDLTPLVYATATVRPLARVSASMLAVGSDGASLGPASVAASGITVAAPTLAPGSRIVDITRVVDTVAGLDITIQPATEVPADGIPVFYGPDTPDHDGPFLWIADLDPLTIYYEDGT
jgi:hypothetical protein